MQKRKDETVRYNFTISKSVYEDLTSYTEENLIQKNQLIESLIKQYLKEKEPK